VRIKEIYGMGVYYPASHKRKGPTLIFSLDAWEEIVSTVGSRPPESGGFLFSCKDWYFVDTFEFDEAGSDRASSVVYSPDTAWANETYERHICNDDRFRVLVGTVHSHPGTSIYPSGGGYGQGDLGYVRKFFDYIPYLEEFLLPIVVFPFGDGFPVLVPWVCKRGFFGRVKLLLAREVVVVDSTAVPYRSVGSSQRKIHHSSTEAQTESKEVCHENLGDQE